MQNSTFALDSDIRWEWGWRESKGAYSNRDHNYTSLFALIWHSVLEFENQQFISSLKFENVCDVQWQIEIEFNENDSVQSLNLIFGISKAHINPLKSLPWIITIQSTIGLNSTTFHLSISLSHFQSVITMNCTN